MTRVLEYLILGIVAVIVGLTIGYLLFSGLGGSGDCNDCKISRPQVRADCDKQFFGTSVRAKQLDAGAEDEFLVAFVDQGSNNSSGSYDPNASTYSAPSYPGATSSTASTIRGPGFVMVRAQPQFGYDYSGSQTSNYDTTNMRPGTSWDEVTVTVVRYVSPLRNDSVCAQSSVRFAEGRFENYCEIPTRFTDADAGQASYRIFVRNESSVPMEYCIVSNCDASAPYGAGSLCQGEQIQVQ